MASLLTRLFPSRIRTIRNAVRPAAKTRLGFEVLDDRRMLSVTAAVSGGVLNVTADNYNTVAQVERVGGDLVVHDNWSGHSDFRTPAAGVSRIVYTAGPDAAKRQDFSNKTDLPAEYYTGVGSGVVKGGGGTNTFYAGTGIATCVGGSGTNLFFDKVGSLDDYEAGSGTNVLYRATDHTFLQTQYGVTPGPMLTVGLRDDVYANPRDLNTPGVAAGITAYLDGTGKVLTIAGPTGGGFKIDGNWTETRTPAGNGQFTHSFTASGTVQLETGIVTGGHHLAIPLPSYGLISVTTKANAVNAPVGEYGGIVLKGGMPLTKDSAGDNAFGNLLAKASLSVNTGGMSWGIKLGSDPTLAALNMPLLANVPYLYAAVSTGMSASFGSHLTASTPGFGGAVVLDPADPAAYVQASTPSGTFSGGVSLHSAIPYNPTNLPPGVENPAIYGNVYVSGAGIALGELPLAVSGNVVIGLDANRDGKLLGVVKQSGTALNRLISGGSGSNSSLADFRAVANNLNGAADDIQFGLNGGVALTTEQYGIALSADVASGSLFYTPNRDGTRTAAFDVGTVNPFAGTVLEKFAPASKVEVGGFVRTRVGGGTPDWGFTAAAGTTSLGGFTAGSLLIEASSATNTAHAHLGVQGMLGAAKFDVDGTVDLRTGDFDLRQTVHLDIDAKVATLSLDESIHFGCHHGVFVADAHLHGSLRVGTADNNFHAYVDGDVSLSVDHGTVHVAGHGDINAGLTVGGQNLLGDASLGFDFGDDGFGVQVGGKELSVKW